MLALALFAMTTPTLVREATFYVGTYTDPNGSRGIYRVRLNTDTGALSEPELAAEATAPGYLCIRPGGKFLYAVNEYSDGQASAFAIEKGGLRKLNTVSFDGRGPCHISTDARGKWLFISAYGGGTLTALPILADGSIGGAADMFKNAGSGPNRRRQEASHLHFAAQVGENVYACDLGTDEVLTFSFDGARGKFKIASPRSGRTEPGAGPRHFVASRDRRRIYVNNEMTLGVSTFERDPKTGQLRLVQTISTLETGATTDGRSTAAVKLHPWLKSLYVSNRGHSSITQFALKADGTLGIGKRFMLDVAEPRDFAIDPSGGWMVVAGQKSGELQSIRIDPVSGDLKRTEHRAKVSKPVCIVFAP